jgi:hypothetical protein
MHPEERSTQALGPAQTSARLQHLTAEHERLRKKVLRRRRELERFDADLREIAGIVSVRTRPLIEEALRLDATIHAAFAQILAGKNLSRRARAHIHGIYDTLMEEGTISLRAHARAHGPEDAPWPGAGDAAPGSQAAPPGAEPGADDGDAGTGHLGRAAHLRDLRKTFLALVDAMHPDKVQSEEEKQARTEAMKELNQAYRDGDLARLLELERAWNLEGKLDPGGGDELERRCQSLERKNELLAEQLRHLGLTLRALRRSEPGFMVVEVRRLRRRRDPDPVATVLEPLDGEIDVLRKLASFVQAFQNGEMSLAQFLDGPDLFELLDEDDDDDIDFDELVILMQKAVRQAARKARKKPRNR